METFQQARERHHLTRQQIAEQAGLSIHHVIQFEEKGKGTEEEMKAMMAALCYLTQKPIVFTYLVQQKE
jgi:transcriptional regulator with XRE-family HTH domain